MQGIPSVLSTMSVCVCVCVVVVVEKFSLSHAYTHTHTHTHTEDRTADLVWMALKFSSNPEAASRRVMKGSAALLNMNLNPIYLRLR